MQRGGPRARQHEACVLLPAHPSLSLLRSQQRVCYRAKEQRRGCVECGGLESAEQIGAGVYKRRGEEGFG